MSTASQISHLPHTAHPIPLREQAFTLHCQGLRSPAISAELGVSERTIRSWVAAALAALKDDLQLSRKEQLLLAVERQHQLTATAWQQFEREAAARNALLDATLEPLDSLASSATGSGAAARPLHLHLPASTPAPRYLSFILQANKETNRLLGLHTRAKLELLTPETASASIPLTDSAIPAESATAFADLDSESPTKTATAIPAESASAITGLAAGLQPANPCLYHPSPSAAESEIPAKTATALAVSTSSVLNPLYSSVPSVPSVLNPRRPAQPPARRPPTARKSRRSRKRAAPLSAHGEGPGVRFPSGRG